MTDCVFCNIRDKKIDGTIIWEDNDIMVIIDAFPVYEGQTLVIPKKHIDYIFDMDDELYTKLWLVAKKTAKAIDKAIKPKRTCIIVEGFGVPHVHIRLNPVPEGQYLTAKVGKQLAPKEQQTQLAQKIKEELK